MAEYLVWCPEMGETEEDARAYDGVSPRFAAQEWAARQDAESADYHIVGGKTSPVVHVQCQDGDTVRFRVHGETVAHYTAMGMGDDEPEGKR